MKTKLIVYFIKGFDCIGRLIVGEKLGEIELPENWDEKGSNAYLEEWAKENGYALHRLTTDMVGYY